MLLRFLLIFLFITNLGFPLNNKIDLFLIGMLIFLMFAIIDVITIKEAIKKEKYPLIIIIFLTIINCFLPKLEIQEAHSIFLNEKDINVISKFIPKEIAVEIENDYKDNFNAERLLSSSDQDSFSSIENLNNANFISKPFAFSSDSFFQNNKYSRTVDKINFNSRENLRIGQYNSLIYNLPFDKHFRRILPYYIIYEIPESAHGSKICNVGNLYYYFSEKKIIFDQLKKYDFTKNTNENCIKHISENNKLYLIGYSINNDDNLEIKLKKNLTLILFDFLNIFLTLLVLFIFLFSFTKLKFGTNSKIYAVSFISTIILSLIRDTSLLNGLRYLRGGADGLAHYSRGKEILEHLIQNDFLMALRGGADIFYFMPGLRYFSSINNIAFGETVLGYLLVCTFIPYLIYKIFEELTNKKISKYLFISFIFIPVFENMGFGHFNYVWQFARYHGESLSILLILFSVYAILQLESKPQKRNINFIFISLMLSVAVFVRPNFFPSSLLLFAYSTFLFFNYKKFILLSVNLIGFSFIFISLFHNIYFGNSLIFFTDANMHFVFSKVFHEFNVNDIQSNFFYIQFLKWNPIYNLHRLLILIFITYYVLSNKHLLSTYIIYLCCISQHLVLLITHPDSRYAYLAWLLTFILFIKILYQSNFYFKVKNLIYLFKR